MRNLIIILLTSLFFISSCTTDQSSTTDEYKKAEAAAYNKQIFKAVSISYGITTGTNVIKDSETGVEYIVIRTFDGGVCIFPRYNADGTLKTGR